MSRITADPAIPRFIQTSLAKAFQIVASRDYQR
jgi:hypothetical protein